MSSGLKPVHPTCGIVKQLPGPAGVSLAQTRDARGAGLLVRRGVGEGVVCASPCSTRSPSPGRGGPTASTSPTSTRSSRRSPASAAGWHAFWTVEHHFLEEYSHCSNPEVLYGAIAAQHRADAPRLRRAAHAEAVQPPGAHRRVGRGARPHLRRPRRLRHRPLGDTRRARGLRHRSRTRRARCGRRRSATSSAAGRTTSYSFEGKHWSMPDRRVQPKPLQQPHPPIWGATTSDDGHQQVGELGLGLCSFAVGVPPEEVKEKIDIYRDGGRRGAPSRSASSCNDQAATFTMALLRADRPRKRGRPRASPSSGTRRPAPARSRRSPSGWRSASEELGNYDYAADMLKTVADDGSLDLLSLEYLVDARRVRARHPRRVHRDVPALRGGRRRPAAVPGEPVQDPARARSCRRSSSWASTSSRSSADARSWVR